jgi:hypothetical protein
MPRLGAIANPAWVPRRSDRGPACFIPTVISIVLTRRLGPACAFPIAVLFLLGGAG